MSSMWRFRGTPHYLIEQARRLRLDAILADRARHNREIYGVSQLLTQLNERYHKCRKPDGTYAFAFQERTQFADALMNAEREAAKLHALAAAAHAMLDEAYEGLGVERPDRHFAVLCDFDGASPLPAGDGTASAVT